MQVFSSEFCQILKNNFFEYNTDGCFCFRNLRLVEKFGWNKLYQITPKIEVVFVNGQKQ